jgi:hypothetical protein
LLIVVQEVQLVGDLEFKIFRDGNSQFNPIKPRRI